MSSCRVCIKMQYRTVFIPTIVTRDITLWSGVIIVFTEKPCTVIRICSTDTQNVIHHEIHKHAQFLRKVTYMHNKQKSNFPVLVK